ncbi:MAG: hypothetical protein ABIA66_03415 [Candidatus Omnitrophota bacterium]
MKKIVIAVMLILIITTPCYAVNIVDTILCKKVVLCANHMTVLVHRVTGKVKYILLLNGQWKLLTGIEKHQCQSMYEAQTSLKLKCD